jgi:hypothetical protein
LSDVLVRPYCGHLDYSDFRLDDKDSEFVDLLGYYASLYERGALLHLLLYAAIDDASKVVGYFTLKVWAQRNPETDETMRLAHVAAFSIDKRHRTNRDIHQSLVARVERWVADQDSDQLPLRGISTFKAISRPLRTVLRNLGFQEAPWDPDLLWRPI